jgi:hypothetical protein
MPDNISTKRVTLLVRFTGNDVAMKMLAGTQKAILQFGICLTLYVKLTPYFAVVFK